MKKIFFILLTFLSLSIGTQQCLAQTGNVGVGTANPTEKLHVAGGIRAELPLTPDDSLNHVVIDTTGKFFQVRDCYKMVAGDTLPEGCITCISDALTGYGKYAHTPILVTNDSVNVNGLSTNTFVGENFTMNDTLGKRLRYIEVYVQNVDTGTYQIICNISSWTGVLGSVIASDTITIQNYASGVNPMLSGSLLFVFENSPSVTLGTDYAVTFTSTQNKLFSVSCDSIAAGTNSLFTNNGQTLNKGISGLYIGYTHYLTSGQAIKCNTIDEFDWNQTRYSAYSTDCAYLGAGRIPFWGCRNSELNQIEHYNLVGISLDASNPGGQVCVKTMEPVVRRVELLEPGRAYFVGPNGTLSQTRWDYYAPIVGIAVGPHQLMLGCYQNQ